MQIRKGGIYKTIESEEFGIWQSMGFEKVITEKRVKVDNIVPVAEKPVIDELPKSKKKKK